MKKAIKYERDKLDVNDIIQFIKSASNEACDFEIDRYISVFRFMREKLGRTNWYQNPEMRAFLEETIEYNPFIPKKYIDLNNKKTSSPKGRNHFLKEWEYYFGKESIQPFGIDVSDYVNKIQTSTIYKKRTSSIGLHHINLFFTKFAEWYISYIYCKQSSFKRIVDIGASSPHFGLFITEFIDDLDVKLIDIEYPSGETYVTDQITQIGTDAGDLSCFKDESVDYVCLHNAFEHFAGDSDSRCINECVRILKPGGKLVIVPFNMAGTYSIGINPITFFFASPYKILLDDLEKELGSAEILFRFQFKMLGHFARSYDWTSFTKRILKHTDNMKHVLRPVDFTGITDETLKEYGTPIYGNTLRYDIFKVRNFSILEITK